jgi:hypothetical protein
MEWRGREQNNTSEALRAVAPLVVFLLKGVHDLLGVNAALPQSVRDTINC